MNIKDIERVFSVLHIISYKTYFAFYRVVST